MDLGIIGLAQSGKTSLFRAVTGGNAHTIGHGALEPSVGVVKVPDERLDGLSDLLHAKKVTHAEVRFLDFPGGLAVRGEGPSGAYLASLGQCDALVHVVRAFTEESVPHPEGSVNPERDVGAVDLELAFADLAAIERRVEKLDISVRSARAGEREVGERELALLGRLREGLEGERPLRAQELSAEERKTLAGYQFLTLRPLLLVLNVDERDVGRVREIEAEYAEKWRAPGVEVAALCAKLEGELAELDGQEAEEFRRDMGIEESGLGRMLRLSQDALGLVTFFTVGEPEGRAWPVPNGTIAVDAAGRIHTDIARGFIRAEVIGWKDLLDCGSYAEARKRGLQRTEGKQYVVQEGDVVHVLFNV
jgi:GTP-binding protein YchF